MLSNTIYSNMHILFRFYFNFSSWCVVDVLSFTLLNLECECNFMVRWTGFWWSSYHLIRMSRIRECVKRNRTILINIMLKWFTENWNAKLKNGKLLQKTLTWISHITMDNYVILTLRFFLAQKISQIDVRGINKLSIF